MKFLTWQQPITFVFIVVLLIGGVVPWWSFGIKTVLARNVAELNVDKTSLPKKLHSPIRVKWQQPREARMVIQVYKEGELIFPITNPHEEYSSGFVLPKLTPGTYEIKLWIPGDSTPYKSVWIDVVN